ncbi:ion transporter [bacterium]|nr:ion transporter [bacterium]
MKIIEDKYCKRDTFYQKIQTRVYEVLEVADHGDKLSKSVDIFLMVLIFANVVHLVLETVESIYTLNPILFQNFETVSKYIFTIEYLLRVWSIGASVEYEYHLKDRLRFMKSPMSLIDLLAVAPEWLPAIGIDFRFLRSFRLLRLIKLTRYSSSMQTFGRVVSKTKDKLVAFAILCLFTCILFSCIIYFVENPVQPEVFSSIPASMWWAIVTMTTVGYGDMAPVTLLGRLLAIPIFIAGIALFAGFTGIIGTAFVEEFEEEKKNKNKRKAKNTKILKEE